MKSYNHLWEKFISDENISLAIKNASKGKRNRKSVKKRLEDPNLTSQIKYYAEHFKNKAHKPQEIYDGIQRKKRVIIVPSFDEQIIHHMLVNTLKPVFYHGMYEHSYGSIPNRGCHKGMRTIRKWIDHSGKNCKYCLKMDIRKYFDSIPHSIYLENLRKVIHDEKIMRIIEEITSVVPKGIALGFYLSQWTANWYLRGLDHFIKEVLRAKHYIRYMDDMVIFGPNKRELHRMRREIENYLKTKLGLCLKDNWQVFRFDYKGKFRALDFMGFRFYRNRITLRRSILLKATRKAKRIGKADKLTVYSCKQMLSYAGWLTHTDTYSAYLKYIKPYVSVRKLRKKISNYDRRQNKCGTKSKAVQRVQTS